jgi:hypothetical protein
MYHAEHNLYKIDTLIKHMFKNKCLIFFSFNSQFPGIVNFDLT